MIRRGRQRGPGGNGPNGAPISAQPTRFYEQPHGSAVLQDFGGKRGRRARSKTVDVDTGLWAGKKHKLPDNGSRLRARASP